MAKRARFELAPMIPIFPQRPGEKDCVFYMRTRTCSYGIACKYDHPAWVPAGGIPDWKEATTTPSKPEALPVRSGEPDCSFYIKTGICKFGSKCKFNHPEDKGASEDVAKSHTSTKNSSSTVTNGDFYGENGSGKPASSYNAKGLPIRPGETECTFYMKTGSCKFGSACRYNHPEKAPSLSTKGTQNQTSVLATLPGAYGNYSIFPGSFPEYAMTLPVSDFGLQSIMQSAMLPQRPGETACAFYMKTGICKFATTCKFHHPLGRKEAAQVDPVKLTLAGYPRREGEQACPFYMKTGTCKYALTCKFDHPPPGEAAAKAIAEAGKSEQLEVGEVYTHY